MNNLLLDKHTVETITKFQINDLKLYQTAMIHKSFISCPDSSMFEIRDYDSYESMEFIGDKCYGFVVSEYLYQKYPMEGAGSLTKQTIGLSRSKCLANFCRKIGLPKYAIVGKKENEFSCTDIHVGRNNEKLLEDIFESFIGAIYLDQGLSIAKKFIIEEILEKYVDFKELYESEQDFKGRLILFCNHNNISRPKFINLKRIGYEQMNYGVVFKKLELSTYLHDNQQLKLEEHCRKVYEPIEDIDETEFLFACGNTLKGTSKSDLNQSACDVSLKRLLNFKSKTVDNE